MAIGDVIKGALKYGQSGMKEKLRQQMRHAAPNGLFMTCMDARLMPNRFTQTHDGNTLFVLRNAGNMIPPQATEQCEAVSSTETAALELACVHSGIHHVVVCGHSDCKAMQALHKKQDICELAWAKKATVSPLSACLKHYGQSSLMRLDEFLKDPKKPLTFIPKIAAQRFEAVIDREGKLDEVDQLSQIHCLQQLDNISSHTVLADLLHSGTLQLHAMWYCVATGDVFFFDPKQSEFVIIDEDNVNRILAE